jgi:hypothetical protein
MNGHDDELIRNNKKRMIFTITSVCPSQDAWSWEDILGLGMNASKGVEESVRDLMIFRPMAEIACGSCSTNSAIVRLFE